MKFGKVENIENIDFTLNKFTSVLTDKRENSLGKFYLGGTGWGNKEWKGSLYPKTAKAGDFLKYYQQQLNTIEFNTTFYRIPSVSDVLKWKNQVGEDFKFCPKVPLLISRTKDIAKMQYYIDEFTNNIRYFGNNLGPCFVQWPEYADLSFYEFFEAFATFWPDDIDISMEFRHKDSFTENSLQIDLLSLMVEKTIDGVITDVAGRRDAAHNTIIYKNILIRFVASGSFEIDFKRLNNWKLIIDSIREENSYNIYFFVHEGENSENAELTIYADQLLNYPNKIQLYKDNINTSGQNQTSLF